MGTSLCAYELNHSSAHVVNMEILPHTTLVLVGLVNCLS